MALINCPDCGNEVSNRALKCPKCSRPIAYDPEDNQPTIYESEDIQPVSEPSGCGSYFAGYVLAFIIFTVKYGFMHGIMVGTFVALLSWIYVLFAIIQAIFT